MLDCNTYSTRTRCPMLDFHLLRDNLDAIRSQLGPRGSDVAWEDLRKLIQERRSLTMKVENERHHVKKFSEQIGKLMRENAGRSSGHGVEQSETSETDPR